MEKNNISVTAVNKNVRSSTRKIALILDFIRGKKADVAIRDLEFTRKRIAHDVKKTVQSAVANAENNYQYDIDNLYVKEAYVGKSIVMKRFRPRAKGRASAIKKPFSRITIILGEKKEIKNQDIYKRIQPWVFFPSAALIILFVVLTLIYQESVSVFFESVQVFIAATFGWLYVVGVNVILIFCIYLAFSRFNNIRLGGPDCKPEFTTWAWISMLFNAGIGLVLMFYSVAEPILHFSNPPYGEAGSIDAAQNALNLSYLHWGLHGWAIYALMGLSIAFFCYNKGLPLGIRWVLYPLLGDRLKGPIGHFIDTIAVVATMFGLATTLGLGIQHINSGMHHLFGIAENTNVQVTLIAIITIFATISA